MTTDDALELFALALMPVMIPLLMVLWVLFCVVVLAGFIAAFVALFVLSEAWYGWCWLWDRLFGRVHA